MKIQVDDMRLNILPPEDIHTTSEEVERETVKLLTIFAGIKQRVSAMNKNHHQYIHLVRQ
jgi:hypothetical protein